MPFTTVKLENEPIIVHTMLEGYSVAQEGAAGTDSINRLLDAQSEPVYLILNPGSLQIGVDDVVSGASLAARGGSAFAHHPNVRETIVVSTSGLIKLAAKGLDSEIFGHVAIRAFGTMDEALAYCRQQAGADAVG